MKWSGFFVGAVMLQTMGMGYPISFHTSIAFPDEEAPKGVIVQEEVPTHFVSAVQFAVAGSTMQRDQRVVVAELRHAVERFPHLRQYPYEIRQSGNEVIFYITSSKDVREEMSKMVISTVGGLEPQVATRGRALFYKTALRAPEGGFLDVSVTDDHRMIRTIRAQAVPLRDVLNEIREKVGGLSYVIPGDCGDQPVDLDFGKEGLPEAKSIAAAMNSLGNRFHLKVEKRDGTYLFAGDCTSLPAAAPTRRIVPVANMNETPGVVPPPSRRNIPRATQVEFRLPPIH